MKDNIEEMVRRGYLSQYKARQDNNSGDNRQHNQQYHAPYVPTQPENSQPAPRVEQAPLAVRQEIRTQRESSRECTDRGKKPTAWVISEGPIYGGTISGAGRSLEEHRHLVSYL